MTILRDPVYPVQLFSSHSLVLTCVIELIPEVDSYISVDSRWSGHSALTDRERRVISFRFERNTVDIQHVCDYQRTKIQ